MGKMAAGKTSMRSIIFANYEARNTYRNTFTVGVETQKLSFLGNLAVSLWDCGGQDLYFN